jgi:hypothetical protein
MNVGKEIGIGYFDTLRLTDIEWAVGTALVSAMGERMDKDVNETKKENEKRIVGRRDWMIPRGV